MPAWSTAGGTTKTAGSSFTTLTQDGVALRAEVHQFRSELLKSALAGRQIEFESLNAALNIVFSNLKLYNARMKEVLKTLMLTKTQTTF